MNTPLSREWIEGLGLSRRRPPEFIQSIEEIVDAPYAGALRVALEDLGLSAVFCIQGVPTITFLVQDEYDENAVADAHKALWNQGLASLLLVISGDTLKAFSLARLPKQDPSEDFEEKRLVETFQRVADALALKELVLGAESGRWWNEHEDFFEKNERIDHVLLENLSESYDSLRDQNLASEAAQALLMQAMFVAYLQDRGIITPEYFRDATAGHADSFDTLLHTRQPDLLVKLFESLWKHFNGDLFFAPCAFEPSHQTPNLGAVHLDVLARFLAGTEEMQRRQLRFWGYDFRYIPVELISAVYDRFLGKDPDARRREGAYYTPMFLADTVVSQVWEAMTDEQRTNAKIIDPACGSGIFLVRFFQRLVEHQRVCRRRRNLDWKDLLSIALRLHGMDMNPSALRVAVFSLYLALLEQVTSPKLRTLMARGKIMPKLWGNTLVNGSFFGLTPEPTYTILIGNPPWSSRRGDTGGAQKWCEDNGFPCPSDEAAWGFVWKAGKIVEDGGLVAFLLPAMGILHNHTAESVGARRKLLHEMRIERIINFSDLSFQLFDGANRPAALVLYRRRGPDRGAYHFDYWCPKADLNLRLKRTLTLSRSDRSKIRSDLIDDEPQLFKRRLWMRKPDEKLLQYLTSFPRLSDLVDEFETHRRRDAPRTGWVIGQGFKRAVPKRQSDLNYSTMRCKVITRHPYLDVKTAFQPLVLPHIQEPPWETDLVHRAGFTEGFSGPHILIPQGIIRKEGRVRAAYTEQDLTFRHSIQAIKFPSKDRRRGKLLTAILNSRLAAWFFFHETANLGTDRAKVHQSELLSIPFPSPEDFSDSEHAERVIDEIVALIDKAMVAAKGVLRHQEPSLEEVDQLVYDYFGLATDEVTVVEDTLDHIIPAIQPHERSTPALWRPCECSDRRRYAETLASALGQWFLTDIHINISLVGLGEDLAVLRLHLASEGKKDSYSETSVDNLSIALDRIWENLPVSLPGNFQIIPDLRVFLDGDLYVVKPRQMRYWLRLSALADADAIAAELQQMMMNQRQGDQRFHAVR